MRGRESPRGRGGWKKRQTIILMLARFVVDMGILQIIVIKGRIIGNSLVETSKAIMCQLLIETMMRISLL